MVFPQPTAALLTATFIYPHYMDHQHPQPLKGSPYAKTFVFKILLTLLPLSFRPRESYPLGMSESKYLIGLVGESKFPTIAPVLVSRVDRNSNFWPSYF